MIDFLMLFCKSTSVTHISLSTGLLVLRRIKISVLLIVLCKGNF